MGLGSTYAQNIGNYIWNQGAPTAINNIWLSLHTGDPGTTGAAECADGTYARQEVTTKIANFSGGTASNDTVIEYAALTTGATITHWGLWTLVSGGAFICGGEVTPDKAVGAGEIPRFAVGELDLTVS